MTGLARAFRGDLTVDTHRGEIRTRDFVPSSISLGILEGCGKTYFWNEHIHANEENQHGDDMFFFRLLVICF